MRADLQSGAITSSLNTTTVRVGLGDSADIYVGYGRALTGEVWYKDLLRLEYRLTY